MGRPKLNGPKKKKLTLTPSDSKRKLLTAVSEALGMSISELVAMWALQDAKRLETENGSGNSSPANGEAPKQRSNVTKTKNMTLTVSDYTREVLAYLSDARKMSITLLVETWGEEEARNLGLINE